MPYYINALEQTDAQILHSELKEAAALVFPTERRLAAMLASAPLSKEPHRAMFEQSRIIYRELQKGISEYQALLQSC